jgi:hypothetical protein
MTVYRNVHVYVHTYCSCGNISNQPTMTVQRETVRKCCRKLAVIRFSWTVCAFLMRQHSIGIPMWTEITTIHWKRQFPSMALKTNGPFLLGLYEEYLWGENRRSSNSVTSYNRGDHNSDWRNACELWHEIEYHFDICQAINGAHTENY